jgi:hypothetical protein
VENSFWRSELQQARIEIKAKQVRLAKTRSRNAPGRQLRGFAGAAA